MFGKFKICLALREKLFCIHQNNFPFFSLIYTNIQLLKRFNLRFWQTSEQAYRKLQHGEEFFANLQDLPYFPRKMALYSLNKFSIIKPCTNNP